MESRKQLLHDIDAVAMWVDVPAAMAGETFCRDDDGDDDKFIHAALAAHAPWLITGDKDLLALAPTLAARELRIISPALALKSLAL